MSLLFLLLSFFFFNDTATTEIYTLSLHDALPICTATCERHSGFLLFVSAQSRPSIGASSCGSRCSTRMDAQRSEEHTSELQSLAYLVCRLLLEKKKKIEVTVQTNDAFAGGYLSAT